MLSIVDHQRKWLKEMIREKITEDVVGAGIKYLYGKTFENVYCMMDEIYGVINTSSDPYIDPAVHAILEKYNYYISPTGHYIYGTGPRFWLIKNPDIDTQVGAGFLANLVINYY